MRNRFFIALVLTAAVNLSLYGITPKAVKGVLDLSQTEVDEKFYLKLIGEWEFYWNKMLRPHDFKARKQLPDYYGKVPSYWTDYPRESVRTEKEGYATYRLKLPPHPVQKTRREQAWGSSFAINLF